MNQVLVTGATGMLGRALVDRLLAAGVQVRALVRPESDATSLAARGVELVTLLEGDMRELSGRTPAIAHAVAGADSVFHLAGYLSSNAPFELSSGRRLPPRYQTVNVGLTHALLAASRVAGVVRFVFSSSAAVYADSVPVPTPESARLAPASHYGRSKQMAEALVRAFCGDEMCGVIVRPAVIYGPGDRYFLPPMLKLLRLPVIPLVNHGRTLVDLVHVQDVVELIWRAAWGSVEGVRVLNAGPGGPVSMADFLDAYRAVTGRGPRILSIPPEYLRATARLFGPTLGPLARRLYPGADAVLTLRGVEIQCTDLFLDMSRAANTLGFRPSHSLQEGIALTLKAA